MATDERPWDAYLRDNVIKEKLDQAIIIDMTGQSVWGKASNLELKPEEMNNIAVGFNDASYFQEHGLDIEAAHYVYTGTRDQTITIKRSEDEPGQTFTVPTIFFVKGKEGLFATKCKSSILVSHFPDTVVATEALQVALTQSANLMLHNL